MCPAYKPISGQRWRALHWGAGTRTTQAELIRLLCVLGLLHLHRQVKKKPQTKLCQRSRNQPDSWQRYMNPSSNHYSFETTGKVQARREINNISHRQEVGPGLLNPQPVLLSNGSSLLQLFLPHIACPMAAGSPQPAGCSRGVCRQLLLSTTHCATLLVSNSAARTSHVNNL